MRKLKKAEYLAQKEREAYERFEADGTDAQYVRSWNYVLDYSKNQEIDRDEIQRKYSLLCTELKFLYVAVTRPKHRLFIYDETCQDRKPIEDIWARIDAVQWVTRESV